MTRWQYAWMTDQPATTIGFSHPQPGLAVELAGVLGPGVALHASTEWSISLDRMRVNLGYVSGLLGDRGWEMFAVETRLQPGAMSPAQLQTNWYFKRSAPEVHPQPTHQQTAPAQPMQPTTPTMQPTTPTMQPTTPTMQPTSAPMQQSTPPIQSTTPPGTYSSTPSAGVPGAPPPQAGGVGFASMNPPAGPEPSTPQFPPPPGPPGTTNS
jgi:hypothetical protein